MFQSIARFRELWHRGSYYKARTQAQRHAAALSGAVIVPAGHAIVRHAGLDVDIDLIPATSESRLREKRPSTDWQADVPSIDIVQAMQYPGRAYAVIGPQQSGKTWVVRHALAAAARAGHRVIVIGPKIPVQEWGSNCEVYGPEWDGVVEGLRTVAKLAKERREAATRNGVLTQSYPPVYVALDDWTECVATLGKEAEKLVVSATTMFASCRIIPTFLLHADTVRSWGSSVGKCLTENFLRVRVLAGDRGGIPDPSMSRYGVLLPGQEERTIDHELVFKQWGLLPAGPPVWPSPQRDNSRDNCWDNAWDNAPFEPESPAPRRETRALGRVIPVSYSAAESSPMALESPEILYTDHHGKERQEDFSPWWEDRFEMRNAYRGYRARGWSPLRSAKAVFQEWTGKKWSNQKVKAAAVVLLGVRVKRQGGAA